MAGGIFDRPLTKARPAKRKQGAIDLTHDSGSNNEPVLKRGGPQELERLAIEDRRKIRANKAFEEVREHLICSICTAQLKTPVALLC